ncbi:MAG: aminomethyl-transferring glycine dehydrogenase subunit GcvPB [Candidatus Dormibacteria bacterium]
MPEELLIEKSRPGHRGVRVVEPGVPESGEVPAEFARSVPLALPEVGEADLMRHYGRLGRRNFALSQGFYPLGSCTMKYNPVLNDLTVWHDGFADLHPYQPESTAQGALELLWRLERALAEVAGVARVTLQPAAGAHGEWTGLRIIQAHHAATGQGERDVVLVPDSSHGTNPATVTLCGMRVREVKSGSDGRVDLADLEAKVDGSVAALMLTNPNTLGLFEDRILDMARLVHAAGGLLYYDGANLNALVGRYRPADMGFDVVHMNLHKTFSVPHGGGGPGSGPVGVHERLVPYLPGPLVERDRDGRFFLGEPDPRSIGRVRSFCGNFAALVRAYGYILATGADGLREVSGDAVLAANYLSQALDQVFTLPYPGPCMHEFVRSAVEGLPHGVKGLDIAKRLLDKGVYAPTIYFPLIVREALMIEPTETESKETLDEFVEAVREVAREMVEDPALVTGAPHSTPVGRLDEVAAARHPRLTWRTDEPASVAPEPVTAG